MKTDRELLELAAKAAEIPYKALPHSGSSWEKWDPLEDDSDALRLAVKLRLDIEFLRGGDFVKVSDYMGDTVIEIDHTGDPAADTRRAITRAAAAIGEGMK